MDSRAYWVWLQQALRPGSGKIHRIMEEYLSPVQFYEAGRADWRLMGIFIKAELDRLSQYTLEAAADLIAVHENSGIHVITPEDVRYPDKLREIYDFPAVLYVKGDLPDVDDRLSIAVVGTRKATRIGLSAAKNISRDLAERDVVVVSGGAMGIDTAAHSGALEAGGQTICVLGCGIGYDYLSGSASMRNEIIRHGALVSEFPKGTPPNKGNFPLRNRIISGLCDGTLVVEAGTSSGSLITARDAREQNRDVFAVPGTITQTTAEGTNNLIKSGAKMVTAAGDILEEYFLRYPYLRPAKQVSFSMLPMKKQEKPVEKNLEKKPAEKSAAGRLTRAEFNRMRREKKWDFDLSSLPSEAEVAVKKQPSAVSGAKIAEKQRPAQEPVPASPVRAPKMEAERFFAPQPAPKPMPEQTLPADLSPEALTILRALTEEPASIADLSAKTGLSSGEIMSFGTELEMEGLAESCAGCCYKLSGTGIF